MLLVCCRLFLPLVRFLNILPSSMSLNSIRPKNRDKDPNTAKEQDVKMRLKRTSGNHEYAL